MRQRREFMLTGTKNRTPVTIEVKAVPPVTREYTFPRSPIAKAPVADTRWVLPGNTRITPSFAAYEQQEKRTMITNSLLRRRWRLESEDNIEYMGTRNNNVHQGNGCFVQFHDGSLKQPDEEYE